MKTIAIILASGVGARVGLDIPKQFYEIQGKSVLEYSILAFHSNKKIDEIIIVSHPNYIFKVKEIVKNGNFNKVTKIVAGGETRQISASNGVNAVLEKEAKILIHDAVRPFVTNRIIDDCINTLNEFKAVNVAIESSDTIIEIDEENCIKTIPQRKFLRRVQTPQGFHLTTIKKAHELASQKKELAFTDDCGLVKEFDLAKIKVIEGNEKNIKITYPSDIKLAENIINICDKI
jgi:2-C-methyl-D-erythritol 4-phosphate cytidylyltransferase